MSNQHCIPAPDTAPDVVHADLPHASSVTTTTTMIPTEASNRRNLIGKKRGSGRATQLRSFTLQLTLPVPQSFAPSPCSSIAPGAVPLGTQPCLSGLKLPIEGVAVWSDRAKTPAVARAAPSSGSNTTATTPGFRFTPMEGVPERALTGMRRHPHQTPALARLAMMAALTPMEGVPERGMPYLQTSNRAARMARMQVWHPAMGEEGAAEATAMAAERQAGREDDGAGDGEPLIHRVGDEVLCRSESASPEPGADQTGGGDLPPIPVLDGEFIQIRLRLMTSDKSSKKFSESVMAQHISCFVSLDGQPVPQAAIPPHPMVRRAPTPSL